MQVGKVEALIGIDDVISSLLAAGASIKGFQGLEGISEVINKSTSYEWAKLAFPAYPNSMAWGLPGFLVTYPFYKEQINDSFKSLGISEATQDERAKLKFNISSRRGLRVALILNLVIIVGGYALSQGGMLFEAPPVWLATSTSANLSVSIIFGAINAVIAWSKGPVLANTFSVREVGCGALFSFSILSLLADIPYAIGAGEATNDFFGIPNTITSPSLWAVGFVVNPAIFALFMQSLIKYYKKPDKCDDFKKHWWGYLLASANGLSNGYFAYRLLSDFDPDSQALQCTGIGLGVLTVVMVGVTKGEAFAKFCIKSAGIALKAIAMLGSCCSRRGATASQGAGEELTAPLIDEMDDIRVDRAKENSCLAWLRGTKNVGSTFSSDRLTINVGAVYVA